MRDLSGIARSAVLVGALLAALGWWLPWVLPERGAAALMLLGLDLGEFWKFTAEWQRGLLQTERLFFFLPPPLAAAILALWLASGQKPERWLLLPLLLFLALVILPDYTRVLPALQGVPLVYPTEVHAREFGAQLYLAVATLLAIALIPLWRRATPRLRQSIIAAIALTGAVLPAWALWRTWPLLQGLYGGGALPGPGIFVSAGGFLLVAIAVACQWTEKARKWRL